MSAATDERERLIALAGVASARVMLDADRHSTVIGAPIRIQRLRLKPGTSLVCGWRREDGRFGWSASWAEPAKAANAVRRAARVGAGVHRGPGGMLWGELVSDPALSRRLARAQALAHGALAPSEVLRHNPLRRAVLHDAAGGRVWRVSASEAGPLAATAAGWGGAGIPVLPVTQLSPGISWSPWWGDGDLQRHPSPGAAAAAGAAIALVHALPATGGSQDAGLDRLIASIERMVPWQRGRLGALTASLAAALAAAGARDGRVVPVHGDLSPDQVLLDGDRIRLIDLDRAGLSAPMRDLGSWVAACRASARPELIDPFLDGYRERAPIDAAALAAWEARAHLAGALEPLRRWQPDWVAGVCRSLAAAEEALARC